VSSFFSALGGSEFVTFSPLCSTGIPHGALLGRSFFFVCFFCCRFCDASCSVLVVYTFRRKSALASVRAPPMWVVSDVRVRPTCDAWDSITFRGVERHRPHSILTAPAQSNAPCGRCGLRQMRGYPVLSATSQVETRFPKMALLAIISVRWSPSSRLVPLQRCSGIRRNAQLFASRLSRPGSCAIRNCSESFSPGSSFFSRRCRVLFPQ
jgi:hypothetical protein